MLLKSAATFFALPCISVFTYGQCADAEFLIAQRHMKGAGEEDEEEEERKQNSLASHLADLIKCQSDTEPSNQ